MNVQDPGYRRRVQGIFEQADFIAHVGVALTDLGPGWCETRLEIGPQHLQSDRFIHAGVQATMADHTAGGAAATIVKATQSVLTVEFKINLLRPAVGEVLHCTARILKPGRTLIVVESELFTGHVAAELLVSKATVTLAVVDDATKRMST